MRDCTAKEGESAEERRSDLSSGAEVMSLLSRPLLVLVGHFGAGKTEIALNLAAQFRRRGEQVTLVDLDIVKPYFRSRQARAELEAEGIELVVPEGEQFYADLPIVVPRVRGALTASASGSRRVIVDAGGDDTGARVLGSLAEAMSPDSTELLFVVNGRRPFAEDADAVVTMLQEVETAARTRVTGLVANTHLMEETSPADVAEGLRLAREVSDRTGIPVKFCAVLERLLSVSLPGLEGNGTCPQLPINRRILPPERSPVRGPLGRVAGV